MEDLPSPGELFPPFMPAEQRDDTPVDQGSRRVSGPYRAYATYPPKVTVERLGSFFDG